VLTSCIIFEGVYLDFAQQLNLKAFKIYRGTTSNSIIFTKEIKETSA
jgi:hypothetical protein